MAEKKRAEMRANLVLRTSQCRALGKKKRKKKICREALETEQQSCPAGRAAFGGREREHGRDDHAHNQPHRYAALQMAGVASSAATGRQPNLRISDGSFSAVSTPIFAS